MRMAKAPADTRADPMDNCSDVEREGSLVPTTAGKLYAATGQIDERCGSRLAWKPKEPGIWGDGGKTKTQDSASNQKGGAGPLRKWKSGLKSFLLLSFEIQWGRKEFWLDGVEASSKVLSYPA